MDTMTRATALRRLEYRTETLARLVLMDAPEIILENQRNLVTIAEGWVRDAERGKWHCGICGADFDSQEELRLHQSFGHL